MASKLEHALALAAKGFKVFPVKAGEKKPPLLNGWPQFASSDETVVRQFWAAVPDANIGLHCAGLLVVDVDAKKGGIESFKQLQGMMDLPPTLTARTPSGGFHVFYRLPKGRESVPNSVEALGKGLDIRSTGGYVVAVGSIVPAGEYAWVDPDAPIAPAPEWLVAKLGSISPKKSEIATVPDAPEASLTHARLWLERQEPAVEGQGGDARTYAVACGLRDRGVSAGQAFDLLINWNDRCSPPWEPADLQAKVRNAYAYAQNEPGTVATVTASMFQTVGTYVEVPTKRHTQPLVQSANDAADEPINTNYLVKNWLDRASYAEIFGAPGEGKTFVALDIGFHVGTDRRWMGNRVRGGLVLYLAFEGKGGLKRRLKALKNTYGDLGKLHYAQAAFNLRDAAGRQELNAILQALPETPVLVVIDTFARALAGGDENSAQDVGALNNALEALIDATGACVLIIHHSGKNKSAGARGSSALLAALETEIEIDGRQIFSRKQREGEDPMPIAFKLRTVPLGQDADNETMTSCVVEQSIAAGLNVKPLNGKGEHAFSVLCEMTTEANVPVPKARYAAKLQAESFGKSASYEWVRRLVKCGKVTIEDDMVKRRLA